MPSFQVRGSFKVAFSARESGAAGEESSAFDSHAGGLLLLSASATGTGGTKQTHGVQSDAAFGKRLAQHVCVEISGGSGGGIATAKM